MKKSFYTCIALLSAALIILSGCSKSTVRKSDKLQITTTFYPMYEFTKKVVGDKANVSLLIPATVEPHDWEPSAKDMANIQKSDLIIFNSKKLETWQPSVEKASSKEVTFVEASRGISLMASENAKSTGKALANKQMDPHVWLDPVLAIEEVKNITKAIVNKDPKNKAYYENNSAKYIKALQQLDQKYRTSLAKAKRKDLITQHAAFGYLAKEYGLHQVAITGITPEQEPSPAKLAQLKKYATKNHIKVIYFEELASPKVAKTLANEVGAKAVVLSPIEGLTTDEQNKGMNYIKVMEDNLKALELSIL